MFQATITYYISLIDMDSCIIVTKNITNMFPLYFKDIFIISFIYLVKFSFKEYDVFEKCQKLKKILNYVMLQIN